MFEIKGFVKKGDYLYAIVPNHPRCTKNGYVLAHRVIMENHLGRLLTADEVVHHIDGNKRNNEISNLEVMDRKEHNRFHSTTGRTFKTMNCTHCGLEFNREMRLVKEGNPFCSRSCNGKHHAVNKLSMFSKS